MGRTVPSYRIAAAMERNKWKIFRQQLNKKDKNLHIIFYSLLPTNYTLSYYHLWLFSIIIEIQSIEIN